MRPLPWCPGLTSALCLLAGLHALPAPGICLPPLFEEGQRLHPLTEVRVMWLDPLLRQHEICWRERTGETRVILLGNSAVFGFPLPAEQSVAGRLNAQFTAEHLPAHVFNLGWVFTYQIRDALILHQALAYRPDVIVYALTLADMMHVAPAFYPSPLVRFFEINADSVASLSAAPPPGLAEPFALYRPVGERAVWRIAAERLRQVGYLTHTAAERHADRLARRLGATPRPRRAPVTRSAAAYDCAETLRSNETFYADFERWNALEYLAAIRAQSGQSVLVVNWPVAREPQGDCYNRRYGVALLDTYNRWLAAECARLGLSYLDLHDLLASDEFLDSLHVTPEGQARIATHVATALRPMIEPHARPRGATTTEDRP